MIHNLGDSFSWFVGLFLAFGMVFVHELLEKLDKIKPLKKWHINIIYAGVISAIFSFLCFIDYPLGIRMITAEESRNMIVMILVVFAFMALCVSSAGARIYLYDRKKGEHDE